MNLGIDKGSAYTKANNKKIRSIVRKKDKDFDLDGIERKGLSVQINDEKYVVGEKGDYATDLLKSQQFNTDILIKTMIAMLLDTTAGKINLVVGLPVAQYIKQKEAIKENLVTKSPVKAIIDSELKFFSINRVEVFPECAGAFYSMNTNKYANKNVLVVDIGGLSIDVISFEDRKMGNYSTYQMGVMKLSAALADIINAEFATQFDVWDMEDIYKNGLRIEGIEVKTKPLLSETINEHTKTIYRTLKLGYDLKKYDEILFVGGGSILLYPYFKQLIPHTVLVENSQFANMKGFQNIAEVLFNENIKVVQF